MLGKFFWISTYHKQCVDKKAKFWGGSSPLCRSII